MKPAIAVIGAGYGDEGKGLATNYFASQVKASIIARCNGGSQAGHTVVTEDGSRHIFGHIGAGTLSNGTTYLAQNFIINPLTFDHERRLLLENFKVNPAVYVHGDCRVTTVYDMAMNSLAETARGINRHGSCGMGINETVTRDRAGFRLRFGDLIGMNEDYVADIIKFIHEEWVPRRIDELQIDTEKFKKSVYYRTLLNTKYNIVASNLLRSCAAMEGADGLLPGEELEYSDDDNVIIEGAQGILLDEYLGKFPFVTRSVTGLASHIKAAAELNRQVVKPVYITRCYTTRHGAGPLDHENLKIGVNPIVDSTNVHNVWQENLRFAPLDINQLRSIIKDDLERGVATSQVFGIEIEKPEIFLTCMDQPGKEVGIVYDMTHRMVPIEELPSIIEEKLKLDVRYTSFGPKASDVRVR